MPTLHFIDTWDRVFNGSVHRYYNIPRVDLELTQYEYDVGVFGESIIDSPTGSIIEPVRTISFFPTTNAKHIIWRHTPSNLTSVKKAIRGVFDYPNMLQPHWIRLYGAFYSENGTYIQHDYWSSPVSVSVDFTYDVLHDYAHPEKHDSRGVWLHYYLEDFWIVLRQPIF